LEVAELSGRELLLHRGDRILCGLHFGGEMNSFLHALLELLLDPLNGPFHANADGDPCDVADRAPQFIHSLAGGVHRAEVATGVDEDFYRAHEVLLFVFVPRFFSSIEPVPLHVALHSVRLQAVPLADGRVEAEDLAETDTVEQINAANNRRLRLRRIAEVECAGVCMEDLIDQR